MMDNGNTTTERLTQYATLSAKLAERFPRGGNTHGVVCDKCGRWLGAIQNDAAVIVGQFVSDVECNDGLVAIGTEMTSFFFLQGRCELKCSCGHVTRRRR